MKSRYVLAATAVSVLAVAWSGGCESAKSALSGSSAVAKAAPASTSLMDKYLGKTADLTSLLRGVKDPASAQAALPKASEATTALKSLADGINQLPPSEKALLGTEYSGKLASAVKGLDEAIAPIQSNPALAKILEPALGGLPKLAF
jgi:hypothetical protein